MSNWIPVSKTIPKDHVSVIVADKHGNVFWAHHAHGEFWVEGWMLKDVAHWFPIPEPPK